MQNVAIYLLTLISLPTSLLLALSGQQAKSAMKILHKQHKSHQEKRLDTQQESGARAYLTNIEQGGLQSHSRDRDDKAGV